MREETARSFPPIHVAPRRGGGIRKLLTGSAYLLGTMGNLLISATQYSQRKLPY